MKQFKWMNKQTIAVVLKWAKENKDNNRLAIAYLGLYDTYILTKRINTHGMFPDDNKGFGSLCIFNFKGTKGDRLRDEANSLERLADSTRYDRDVVGRIILEEIRRKEDARVILRINEKGYK